MYKKVSELKKGDIFRTEFGVDGNWITVELLEPVKYVDRSFEYKVFYVGDKDKKPFTMYGLSEDETVEIIEEKKLSYPKEYLEMQTNEMEKLKKEKKNV